MVFKSMYRGLGPSWQTAPQSSKEQDLPSISKGKLKLDHLLAFSFPAFQFFLMSSVFITSLFVLITVDLEF